MSSFNDFRSVTPYSLLHTWSPPVTDDKADTMVLGVASDMMATTAGGQREAPDAIRGTWFETYDFWNDFLLTKLTGWDLGNAPITTGSSANTETNVAKLVAAMLERSHLPVVIGGDDGINLWVAKGFEDFYPETMRMLVHLDAHLDCIPPDAFGQDHSTWIRGAMNMNRFQAAHVAGVRALGRPQDTMVQRAAIGDVPFIVENAVNAGWKVMLGIDMDVIDPAFAPGVAVPEPFGATPWEVDAVLRQVADKISILTVTEVTPSCDVNGITAQTAHRLITRAMEYNFMARNNSTKKLLKRHAGSAK